MPPRKLPPIDFGRIAAAALQGAETLVPQWLKDGRRVGHEWQCGSLSGDAGSSCSVNLNTGAWADFATGEKGRDLISLYGAINGLENGPAARELAEQLGIEIPEGARSRKGDDAAARRGPIDSSTGAGVEPGGDDLTQVASKTPDGWSDAGVWPEGGPAAPVAHMFRGRPSVSWVYRTAEGGITGYVHRFVTSDGGKEILPCVWSTHPTRGNAWKWRQWDQPRPLYRLEALAEAADRPVLVVEGEKCADAAAGVVKGAYWVTTWSGGGNAVHKADFTPLAGRRVIVWPDCDAKLDKVTNTLKPEDKQPGVRAMERAAQILLELGCDVSIVAIPRPGDRPDGWDVFDLIAEAGENASAAVHEWLQPDKLRRPRAAEAAAPPNAPPPAEPDSPPWPDPDDDWSHQLVRERNGSLSRHVVNVSVILRNDPGWKGVVVFDEFSNRVIKRAPPPYGHGRAGEWTSDDDSRTASWLAQQYGLMVSSLQVLEGVEMVARESPVHPVREYLQGLKWDGTPRLAHWLIDYAGVEDTEYARAVSTFFLRAMARRVMEPGCKFDYCLVLEGSEGLRKSTLASLLGGPWFSDTDLDLTHKDSMSALQGKWLHEFSEMDSVTRAEASKQKSFLSRQVDEFRPVYGRRQISCPRQSVFIGTTNEDEYIKEGQGARRFWPIKVRSEIDINALREIRDQLFAEAMHDCLAGLPCAPDSEMQRTLFRPIQTRRVVQESMIDALHDWVLDPGQDELTKRSANGGTFSLADAAARGLHIGYAQLTRDLQTRIGKALHALGCERIERRNGMTRFAYKAPARNGPTSTDASPPEHNPFAGDGYVDI
jgi:putative DNA primase/helicase